MNVQSLERSKLQRPTAWDNAVFFSHPAARFQNPQWVEMCSRCDSKRSTAVSIDKMCQNSQRFRYFVCGMKIELRASGLIESIAEPIIASLNERAVIPMMRKLTSPPLLLTMNDLSKIAN